MKVILTQTIDKVGHEGEVVEVRDGFARNHLLPERKAVICTPQELKKIEEAKKFQALREQKMEQESKGIAKKINETSLTIKVSIGEKEKMFGSVTAHEIVQQLKEKGISIDKKQIDLKEPIKTLGVFEIPVKLTANVSAHLKLWVVDKK